MARPHPPSRRYVVTIPPVPGMDSKQIAKWIEDTLVRASDVAPSSHAIAGRFSRTERGNRRVIVIPPKPEPMPGYRPDRTDRTDRTDRPTAANHWNI